MNSRQPAYADIFTNSTSEIAGGKWVVRILYLAVGIAYNYKTWDFNWGDISLSEEFLVIYTVLLFIELNSHASWLPVEQTIAPHSSRVP